MAPIKFEEQLKDKLEKRTLSPSSDGWSKLSERLDADEKKSKNPIFWWLSIAAGLIIMITVTVQFFGTEESEKVMPNLVEENVIEEKSERVNPELEAIKSSELADETNTNEEIEKASQVKASQLIDQKNLTRQKSPTRKQLAEVKKTNKGVDLNNEYDLIQQKRETNELDFKNAVAEALNDLKTDDTSVSDREIDSLLKLASKALFRENLNKESTKTVDANALLMSVQDEMGQSFRSRVFEALKDSYATVKTAVAERNQ